MELARTASARERARTAAAVALAVAYKDEEAQAAAKLATVRAEILAVRRTVELNQAPACTRNDSNDACGESCALNSAATTAPGDALKGGSDGKPLGQVDVAKRVYLALRTGDLDAAARCAAEATDDELLVRSDWEQR